MKTYSVLNNYILDLSEKYNSLLYNKFILKVPYFINTAELIYKSLMKQKGVDDDVIKSITQEIKDSNSPLGSGVGKGSPEQIQQDLARMMRYLKEIGYEPDDEQKIRMWMRIMHVGLDCSGYIFNIIKAIEQDQNVELLKLLAWVNPEDMKPSHAGAFIFDSKNLMTVKKIDEIRPLDIAIYKNYTHVGIFAEKDSNLYLTDCSMGFDGIEFFKVDNSSGAIKINNSNNWTEVINNQKVVIKRFC